MSQEGLKSMPVPREQWGATGGCRPASHKALDGSLERMSWGKWDIDIGMIQVRKREG